RQGDRPEPEGGDAGHRDAPLHGPRAGPREGRHRPHRRRPRPRPHRLHAPGGRALLGGGQAQLRVPLRLLPGARRRQPRGRPRPAPRAPPPAALPPVFAPGCARATATTPGARSPPAGAAVAALGPALATPTVRIIKATAEVVADGMGVGWLSDPAHKVRLYAL